jgi:hypothetical protein
MTSPHVVVFGADQPAAELVTATEGTPAEIPTGSPRHLHQWSR